MNPTSLLFALFIAGLFAAVAWIVDFGARYHNHWSPRRRRLTFRFLLGLALALGLYAYFADAHLRGTTLFEVSDRWEETGGRPWTVLVENPRQELTLMVYPHVLGLESASRPVTLRTRFGIEGEPPLVDDESVYRPVRKTGKGNTMMTWQSKTFRVVPRHLHPHVLTVTAVGEAPTRLHLRISDPTKRDGTRAPGY